MAMVYRACAVPAPQQRAVNQEELATRIQSLCQELQDLILHHKLMINLDDIVEVDEKYTAWQLQIDRRTRKEFAKQYYNSRTFCVPTTNKQNRYELLFRWLQPLSAEHFCMISEVYVEGYAALKHPGYVLQELRGLRDALGRSEMDGIVPALRMEVKDFILVVSPDGPTFHYITEWRSLVELER